MENKSYWEVWKLTVHTDDGDCNQAQEEWDKYVKEHYDKIVNWVNDFKYFDDEYSARKYFNNAKNDLTYRASQVIVSCFHHDVLLLVETNVRSDDDEFEPDDFDICDTAIGKKCESEVNEWTKRFQATAKADDDNYWEVWSAWVYIDEEDYYKAWAKWEDFTEKCPQKIPNEITARYSYFVNEESARKLFDYYKEKLLYRLASDGEKFMYEVLMLVQTYTSADVDEMDEDDFDIIEWDIAKVYSSPQKKWWQKNTKKI